VRGGSGGGAGDGAGVRRRALGVGRWQMSMRFSRTFRGRVAVVAMLAVAALPCFAGEVAVLKNGFSIRHERREIVGDVTRLYVTADGSSFVDVPTAEIEHYEAAPEIPAPALVASAQKSKDPPFDKLRTGPLAKYARNGVPGGSNFPTSVDLQEVVNSASGRYRLDPDLVNSVIKAESGFNVHAVSPKGAQGLMQLMPGTASQLGVPNAFDPQANVEGGTKYLRELLERYNFDLVKALAAYNAGPQRVEQFGGVPPYYETRAYVARVVRDFNKKKVAEGKAARPRAKATSAKPSAGKTDRPPDVATQAKANSSPNRE
jgi:Transglycosylase SLT domain